MANAEPITDYDAAELVAEAEVLRRRDASKAELYEGFEKHYQEHAVEQLRQELDEWAVADSL
jgi:hypothetical protein